MCLETAVTNLDFRGDFIAAKRCAAAEGPIIIAANGEGCAETDLIAKGRKAACRRPFLSRVQIHIRQSRYSGEALFNILNTFERAFNRRAIAFNPFKGRVD